MSTAGRLVGVDAGATKSVAIAVRPDGGVLGRATGGGANPRRQAREVAADRIARLATAAAGGPPDLVLVAGAGIDRPEHATALAAALGPRLTGARIVVVNDTLAALRAGTPDAVGLVVPVSTGGNVIGRGPDGRVTDRGHGIFGGGYVLGALAARAARRGRLSAALAANVEATPLRWSGRRPGPEVTSLAPAVVAAAAAGETYPARMIDRWCGRITAAVREEVERLGLPVDVAVVIYGGLLDASPWLERRVRAAIAAGVPAARISRLGVEPADGAALLARDAWAGAMIAWTFSPRRPAAAAARIPASRDASCAVPPRSADPDARRT